MTSYAKERRPGGRPRRKPHRTYDYRKYSRTDRVRAALVLIVIGCALCAVAAASGPVV